MLIPAAERRIWLCVAPTDMRRSFDGLAALARNHLGEDPADGSWFVYVNRRRTIVKVLSFDGGGYWVWSKRLEAGRFADPGVRGGRKRALDRRLAAARQLRPRLAAYPASTRQPSGPPRQPL